MLLYPVARRPAMPTELCRLQPWAPPPSQEAFARYFAKPYNPHLTQQINQLEEDDWSGSSSPERECSTSVCGWRECGARVESLSAHIARTHAHPHTDGLYYCGWNDCARPHRGFNARYKMLVHIRTHTNERPHTCSQCEKSFSRAENLKIHLRSHSGEKPYVCPYPGCNKAYSNSSDRFKHTRTHTVEKPYCCKVPGCNKRYTDPSSLRKHVKTYKHYAPKTDLKDPSSPNHELEGQRLTAQTSHDARLHVSPLTHYTCVVPMTDPLKIQVPLERYSPVMTGGYISPVPEPLYPLRVPPNEMSYGKYSQMYEHAYRNYYSSNYPVVREEKIYSYSSPVYEPSMEIDVENTDEPTYCDMEADMPLNLKCSTSTFSPVEDILRRSDLPLDLSTKS